MSNIPRTQGHQIQAKRPVQLPKILKVHPSASANDFETVTTPSASWMTNSDLGEVVGGILRDSKYFHVEFDTYLNSALIASLNVTVIESLSAFLPCFRLNIAKGLVAGRCARHLLVSGLSSKAPSTSHIGIFHAFSDASNWINANIGCDKYLALARTPNARLFRKFGAVPISFGPIQIPKKSGSFQIVSGGISHFQHITRGN